MCATATAISAAVCEWCGGAGYEPDEENGSIPCLSCNGHGVYEVEFDLGPNRTCKSRVCQWCPITQILSITRKKLVSRYKITEFGSQIGGRAFRLDKLDQNNLTTERYDVLIGGGHISCDCKGSSYQTSARANQQAYYDGRDLVETLGCVHLDALRALIAQGWMEVAHV